MSKTFLKVTANHGESGRIRPLFLTWTDGRIYEIERSLFIMGRREMVCEAIAVNIEVTELPFCATWEIETITR